MSRFQASRLGHDKLVRLLLDCGADTNIGHHDKTQDISIISRCSSVVTRSMSKNKNNRNSQLLDKSILKGIL